MSTRFDLIRKTSEPYYKVPSGFVANLGIINISKNGICHWGDNVYSKAFRIDESVKEKASMLEKIKGSMMVLRSYDVPFKYIECVNGDVYLDVCISATDFENAKKVFEKLENDMASSLYTFGFVPDPMGVQERIRYMHRYVMRETKNTRIDVNDYLKNPSSYLSAFECKGLKEKHHILKSEAGEKGFFYIRRISSENFGTLYELIRNNSHVGDIMIDYEPVSDLQVANRINELYDGVSERELPEADERKRVMVGVYFSLIGNADEIENASARLNEELLRYGCEVSAFYFRQKEAFQSFTTFNTQKIKELRLIYVTNAVPVNPFTAKKSDTSLLDVFDSLMTTVE